MVSLCCCRSSPSLAQRPGLCQVDAESRARGGLQLETPEVQALTSPRPTDLDVDLNGSETPLNFCSSLQKKAESCLLINLHPLRLFSVVVRVGTGEAARLPSLRLQV